MREGVVLRVQQLECSHVFHVCLFMAVLNSLLVEPRSFTVLPKASARLWETVTDVCCVDMLGTRRKRNCIDLRLTVDVTLVFLSAVHSHLAVVTCLCWVNMQFPGDVNVILLMRKCKAKVAQSQGRKERMQLQFTAWSALGCY